MIEVIEPIKAEIAAIDAALPGLRERVNDAKDEAGEVADIEAKWLSGEDVPALDYLLAQAEDTKAEKLATGLASRRDRLRKRLPASHTVLADHVVPVIEAVLPWAEEVHTTWVQAKAWQQDLPADTVAVVLVQEPGALTDPRTGVLSGEVALHYFRPAKYKSLNVTEVEEAARSHKIALEVGVFTPGDEVDVLRLKVSGVVDGLPTIRRVGPNGLVVQWVRTVLHSGSGADWGRYSTGGRIVSDRNEDGTWSTVMGSTSVHVLEARIVEAFDEDGTRTVTLEQTIRAVALNPSDFVKGLREQAHMWANSVTSLGMLTETSVEFTPGASLTAPHEITVVSTYRSKVPTGEWEAARNREQAEKDNAEQVRELGRTVGEERRQQALDRRHPAVKAAAS